MKLYIVGLSGIDSDSLGEQDTTLVLASTPEEAKELACKEGYYYQEAVEINMFVPRILSHEPYQEWNSF